MKRVVLVAWVTFAIATPAFSQEKIELFADANRTACEISDQGGVVTLHVFLTGPDTATLAAFRAHVPDCWQGATWLSDFTPYVSIGTSQGEWSVAFGQCLTPPVHVGEISVMTTGTAPSCCEYKIQQPISFPLQYVDCAFAETNASAGQVVIVNPTPACHCQLPVATQSSTWGRVKSLYR
jgi:hypothetical protein